MNEQERETEKFKNNTIIILFIFFNKILIKSISVFFFFSSLKRKNKIPCNLLKLKTILINLIKSYF